LAAAKLDTVKLRRSPEWLSAAVRSSALDDDRPRAGDGGIGSGMGIPSTALDALLVDLWYTLGEYEWAEFGRVPVLLLRVSSAVDVVFIA
jgi:hypothetical protein